MTWSTLSLTNPACPSSRRLLQHDAEGAGQTPAERLFTAHSQPHVQRILAKDETLLQDVPDLVGKQVDISINVLHFIPDWVLSDNTGTCA